MSATWIRQHLNGSLSPVHAGPSFLSLPSSQVTPNTFLQTPCSAFELISLPLSQRQDLYSIINPFQSPHSPHKSIVTAYSIPPLQSKKKKNPSPTPTYSSITSQCRILHLCFIDLEHPHQPMYSLLF